jgi:cytochrome P450
MRYISELGGTFMVMVLTYYIFNVLRLMRRRQRLMEEHGCREPPMFPLKDPIFGLDLLMDNAENIKRHRMLDGMVNRWKAYGTTYGAKHMSRSAIFTVDARNLQTVHGLRFSNFGVQPLRRDATLPFLGEGVFTMDGPFWEHSRSLIRPTFKRSNVANLEAFEVHFKKFLRLIPLDGSTIDLQPCLYRLVCYDSSHIMSPKLLTRSLVTTIKFLDTSTEFLFGESMNSLSAETPIPTQQFLDAFHYAQRGIAMRMQLGKLRFLYQSTKWRESIKEAHAFADRYVDKALEFRRSFLVDQETKQAHLNSPEGGNHELRYILLHEMAKETDNREDLRSQIIHVFLGGHDSTAITVSNAMFHLCRNLDSWRKLREEIISVGDMPFTFESLKSFQYLQFVIKESE